MRFSYVTDTAIAYGQINPVRGLATAEAYSSAVFAALVVYTLIERSEV